MRKKLIIQIFLILSHISHMFTKMFLVAKYILYI